MENIEKQKELAYNNEDIKKEIFNIQESVHPQNIDEIFHKEVWRRYKDTIEDNKKLFSVLFIQKNNLNLSKYLNDIWLSCDFQTRKDLFKRNFANKENYKWTLEQNTELFHHLIYRFELKTRLEKQNLKKTSQKELWDLRKSIEWQESGFLGKINSVINEVWKHSSSTFEFYQKIFFKFKNYDDYKEKIINIYLWDQIDNQEKDFLLKKLDKLNQEGLEYKEKLQLEEIIKRTKNDKIKIHRDENVKKAKNERIKNKEDIFGNFQNFLSELNLESLPEFSFEEKFLKTFRYNEQIEKIANKFDIPKDLFFALIMVESGWNALSVNSSNDWGAGILHMQPWLAKEYGLTLYSQRLEKYQKYDSNSTWYSPLHWKGLKKLLADYDKDQKSLSQIDDRFNVKKCLETAAKYIQDLYNHRYIQNFQEYTTHDSRENYKKDSNFKRMLAINWYNKGLGKESWIPKLYKNFEDWSLHWHMKNIRRCLKKYKEFVNLIEKESKKQASMSEILEKITEAKINVKKTKFWKLEIKELTKKFIKVQRWDSLNKVLNEANRRYWQLYWERLFVSDKQISYVAKNLSKDLEEIYPWEKIRFKKEQNKIVFELKGGNRKKEFLLRAQESS